MTIDRPLFQFSKRLLEEGVALVPWWKGANAYLDSDIEATKELVLSVGRHLQLDAPSDPPSLDPQAAIWSLQVVHWLAWQLLDRLSAEIRLPLELQNGEPTANDPTSHWSVDVGFRFLRSLHQKGVSMSSHDPILQTMYQLNCSWPLASLQVPAEFASTYVCPADRINPVKAHECLNRIWKSRNEKK